jgi:hypothetical protein
MGVHLRRPETLVAEKFLNHAEVRAAIKQMRCERVTQRVWMEAGGEPSALRRRVESRACAAFAKWRTVPIKEECGRRLIRRGHQLRSTVSEVALECVHARRTKERNTLLLALPCNAHLTARKIEISHLN